MSYASCYLMEKATASTMLRKDKDMSPTLAEAIISKKHCLYCAHRADKLNLSPPLEKKPGFHNLGFFISEV